MKIGVHFSARKANGGIYQYSVTFIEAVLQMKGVEVLIFNASDDLPEHLWNSPHCKVIPLTDHVHQQLEISPRSPKKTRLLSIWKAKILQFLPQWIELAMFDLYERRKAKIVEGEHPDLLLFPTSAELSYLTAIPSIVAIHDLQHRLNPQFPEVSRNGQYNKRERLYKHLTQRAVHLISDSEVGKEDIVQLYSVDPDSITPLPYLPPDYLEPTLTREDASTRLAAPWAASPFFFYPAQLWPHKNHQQLIRAFAEVHAIHPNASLVLVGQDKPIWGVRNAINSLARALGVSEAIHHLGYVTNAEMSALYRLATGLVMPTYFGPSNIPILEAWRMRCPVVYSDIRGCREQAGDAALLADPNNPHAIARHMLELLENPDIRLTLIAKGEKQLDNWTISHFVATLQEVIQYIYEKTHR